MDTPLDNSDMNVFIDGRFFFLFLFLVRDGKWKAVTLWLHLNRF